MDIGLYEKYNYIKYYDFFNQNQGLYSIQQKVSITGFHLLPSYHYYFRSFKKKFIDKFFAGAIVDLGHYKKNLDYFNTLTTGRYSDSYKQTRLGLGLSLGFKHNYQKRIFLELKTSLITKIMNHISEKDGTPIMALDAQWTSTNYNFWLVSNIKMGYAF